MLNIDEEGNIHDRIMNLVSYFSGGNKAAFGRGADIQSGVLAGIIAGRKNKPSFEVLQKILTGYPNVNPMWLLFGRGPLLLKDAVWPPLEPTIKDELQRMATKQVYDLTASEAWQKNMEDAVAFRAKILHDQTASNKLYVVGDKYPERYKNDRLAARLKISEESALQLVREGKIKSININPEEGFRVTELWVQQFEEGWGTTSPITEK